MAVQFTWSTPGAVGRYARPLLSRRMDAAARQATLEIRARVARPYPPASRPGEPPRRRTGNLLAKIGHRMPARVRVLAVSFVSRARYAAFLQKGTSRMAARPYLFLSRSAIARFMRTVGRGGFV